MKRLVIPTIIAVVAFLAGCNSQAVDDSAITAKVKSKLATDSQTSAIRISVETKGGVVTLTGNVPSDTEKSKAETLAKNTDGVKRVQNEIKVTPESSSTVGDKAGEAAQQAGEAMSDAAILAKLKAKLLADGITGTDVDVTNGAVILKGQVEDPQKKAKAEELAKNTSGVKDVRNELTVKKYKAT
ncbi:MAG TPA: BON domain-containing protein [Blastocatellia bacterium]|nr:BON domain-containing protein [Blastocatellia bacterium]